MNQNIEKQKTKQNKTVFLWNCHRRNIEMPFILFASEAPYWRQRLGPRTYRGWSELEEGFSEGPPCCKGGGGGNGGRFFDLPVIGLPPCSIRCHGRAMGIVGGGPTRTG